MTNNSTRKPKFRPNVHIVIFSVFLLIGAVVAGYIIFKNHRLEIDVSPVTTKSVDIVPVVKKLKYSKISGKYLFSGTVMMGRGVELVAKGDLNQPFSGMSTLGSYDANIGVLECPITSNKISYQSQVDTLKFNCGPEWLPVLKKYFPIIDLSSNHLYDMGKSGFDETVNRLNDSGFQVVGNFNPHIENDNCKVVSMPVRLITENAKSDSSHIPIVMCSYNYKTIYNPSPGELESIQKWSKIMPVIGLMNGGPEYQHTAGAAQMDVAHKMIDYGADVVVGNGTHWIQNTEVYKGKLIEYSMGNFIFDQLDYDGRIALNLSVEMTIPYDNNASVWIDVAKACVAKLTACPDEALKLNASKLSPKYDFKIVGSYGGSGKIATLANAQQQKDVEERANWAQTVANLESLNN